MEIKDRDLWEDVFPEDYLELSSGEVVKNLVELVEALREMDMDSFRLHVYGSQNDFSDWILEAYGNNPLAKRVRRIRGKDKLVKFLSGVLNNARIDSPKRKKDILERIGRIE